MEEKRGNGEMAKNLPKIHSFFRLFLTFDFFVSLYPFPRFPSSPNPQSDCGGDLTPQAERIELYG